MEYEKSENTKYLIPSVEKAIKVLKYASAYESFSFKDLTEGLNEPRTSLYRVVATLEHYNYIIKQSNQRYVIGPEVLSLSTKFLQNNSLKMVAQKPMRKLLDKYQETVNLGVLSGTEIIYIDILEGSYSLRMMDKVGSKSPAYTTGLGKAILSQQDNSLVKSILENSNLIPVTKNTITSPKDIMKEIENTRIKGYAFDNEEIVEGARCIACPIFDLSGRVKAAISISGLSQRFPLDTIDEIAEEVKKAALEVSIQLGYKGEVSNSGNKI